MKKIKRVLDDYGRWLTFAAILICIAGLVISYVKPKQKLETVAVNMEEERETDVELTSETEVTYVCSTRGYAMAGIQVGVCKYGRELSDGALLCRVYDETKEQLLSETLVQLKDLDDGQYVYIPFENHEQCNGTLCIVFTYSGEESAGLKMNAKKLEDAQTLINGEESTWMLKSYYIYKLSYYPLLYDLCLLLFLFGGVFFLSESGKGKKKAFRKEGAAADE